jgi:hypothetical protein
MSSALHSESGRTFVFDGQPTEGELTLLDPARQLNAGDGDRRRFETMKPQYRPDATPRNRPT